MNGDIDDPYRQAIRALSDARMAPESATRIERELLSAFAEHRAAVRPVPSTTRRGVWRPWMAAAAAALIAVAASIEVWRLQAGVTVNNVTKTPSREDIPAPPAAPLVSPAVVPVSPPSVPARGASARAAGQRRRIVRPAGFVELPGAADLPQFESGTIVRLELPVASLPAYGIEIPAAADERPVEADLLVGQDGLTRAIRLVARSNDTVGARDSHSNRSR
jgi:hypothetical protein